MKTRKILGWVTICLMLLTGLAGCNGSQGDGSSLSADSTEDVSVSVSEYITRSTPEPTVTPTLTATPTAMPAATETPTPEPTPQVGDMAVHFLDVGQGLSILV